MRRRPRAPAATRSEAPPPYVVLARKYRPATFDDLIGQDAMVTTLRNAFATDRIAQGYMLTGVRGVGKTTTARILSRALNYEREGVDKPTFDMPEFGRHCAEIMEGRHPDVLEMDAASNTGVDNIREIIESARYRPLMARYKVYLIDEVHMLSKGAFNALLKTLEEPPGHVKFIFATTEVRKVPVTVLSRTQRFDLRRVDVPVLTEHFRKIVGKEGARGRGRRAGADRARRRRLRARRAVAARPGAGHGLRHGRRHAGARHAGASPTVAASSICSRRCSAGRPARRWSARAAAPGWRRAAAGACRSRRCRAHHDARQDARRRGGGRGAFRRGTATRRGAGRAAVDGDPVARLADAAEGPGGGGDAPNPAAAAEMVLIRLAYTADLPAPDEIIKALGGDADGQRAGKPPAPSDQRHSAPVAPLNDLDADDGEDSEADEDGEAALDAGGAPLRYRSCARSPTWSRWPAATARPSSRCIWKST